MDVGGAHRGRPAGAGAWQVSSNDLGIVTGHSGQADAARSMEAAAAH